MPFSHLLLGELQKDSEEKCVFVKGVIKSVVEDKGERIRFDENVWNRIYSDTEKYFPNLSVVGWFAVVPDLTSERMARLDNLILFFVIFFDATKYIILKIYCKLCEEVRSYELLF